MWQFITPLNQNIDKNITEISIKFYYSKITRDYLVMSRSHILRALKLISANADEKCVVLTAKCCRFHADLNAEMVFRGMSAISLCLGTRGEIGQRAISH